MVSTNWNIGVVQMDCTLGQIEPNLKKVANFATLGKELGAEIVVFPECATTGYFVGSKLRDLAEPPNGPTSRRIGEIARSTGLYLAIGSFTRVDDAICNSQLLFDPSGNLLAVYHKSHLFAGERDLCRPGDRSVVVDTRLGRIGMTICYDLIFPDYVRKLVDQGADFIINSTDWINDRYQREVWGWGGEVTQSLASVRALENGTFLAMANRIGREAAAPGIDFDSFGYSCVAGPSGRILASIPDGEGIAIAHINVSADDLAKWRSIATYRQDRRPELYS